MKKNISINISGIIFHIEEDGYDRLKKYLESINQYFSSFDDSKEILADIESRIAEIFLTRLKDGKQVITKEDVDELVATMGSVADFEAIEEQISPSTETQTEAAPTPPPTESRSKEKRETSEEASKKLYRDTKRKLLGGVAAGIAHYFSIDPLWIRLMFIILLFNVVIGIEYSSVIVIIYVVCWIVIPPSGELEEDKKVKKMFRNPDDRVLGGVASGLAAYFGVDVTVIRLLFVLTLFLGGSGLIIYIILWIITPEAKTITEKMQMQGESLTLSNIETNIKKSFKVKDDEENIFVKILLFPFRIIAAVINGLSKALGPLLLFLVEAIRVLAGIVLTITGIALLIAVIIMSGVFLGVDSVSTYSVMISGFPVDMLQTAFSPFVVVSAAFFLAMPALALSLLGIAITSKSRVMNARIGWSLFAIWVISIATLSVGIPGVINDFKTDAELQEKIEFKIPQKVVVLRLNETGMDDYEAVSLRIRGYSGKNLELVQNFTARGSSRMDAIENARMVSYRVAQEDSVLFFDSNIQFEEDANFRMQELEMTLYIPFGETFLMDQSLKHILRNTLTPYNYRIRHLEENHQWSFTRNELVCITCDEIPGTTDSDAKEDFYERGFSKVYNVGEFSKIHADGPFRLIIVPAEEPKVEISGEERYLDDIEVFNDNGELNVEIDINFRNLLSDNYDDLIVRIETPEFTYLKLDGGIKANVSNFDLESLELVLDGNTDAEIEVKAETLRLEMQGVSSVKLRGSGNQMDVELDDAVNLEAFSFRAERITMDSEGASRAKIYATESIDIEAGGISNIRYRGNAVVTANTSDASKIVND